MDNFEIIAARYEGNKVFGSILYATCNNERHAKAIVDALNNSDEAILFHFSYMKGGEE